MSYNGFEIKDVSSKCHDRFKFTVMFINSFNLITQVWYNFTTVYTNNFKSQ